MSNIFEKVVAVFPVPSGTGANALALSTMVPSFGAVLCHEEVHINVDECGAVELYTGGCKLIGLAGLGAKLNVAGLEARLAAFVRGDHDPRRCAVSITQASELQTQVNKYLETILTDDFIKAGGTIYAPTAEEKKSFQGAKPVLRDWFIANIEDGELWYDKLEAAVKEAEAAVDAERAVVSD